MNFISRANFCTQSIISLQLIFVSISIIALSSVTNTGYANEADKSKSVPYTFVIVHGATGGGWDWKTIANGLITQGHTVYRPTLSGLGDRAHLASEEIKLTTHITDVANLIEFEQLNDVILLGHSYGGMVITGVANRMPERIKHLTFLDAAVPGDGMTALEVWGTKLADLNVREGLVYFPWLDDSKPLPRDMPHPLNTLTEAVAFNKPEAKKINASYVAFVPEGVSREQRADDPSWHRAEARGWTIRTFDGDHVVYRVKPDEFVEMLLQTTADRNRPISN